ncbi:399_t:CDS:2, partial [Acaulospora colombiana]
NADDAGARTFKLYIDERDFRGKDRSSLLTEGMHHWQGPALWIYNDAEFNENDFNSLLSLGRSDKLSDKTKIGRFGIGFNSIFNLTDLPSFVSGEYITFLDPHSKYLPELGNPPRNPLGNRYNFVKAKFRERWYSQAEPYISVEGCDLIKRYNGTLFRIPLRTYEVNNSSEISECSLHYLDDNQSKLIWKTRINDMDENIRNMRRSITDEAKVFQLNIEMQVFNHGTAKHVRGQTNKSLEHWLLCSGGNEKVREDLKTLSDEKKPRGAVAALIANMEENDEKNDGEFISFSNAVFGESKREYIVPDLLKLHNVPIVKVSEEQYKHLEELSSRISPNLITSDLVCNTFRNKKNMWDSYITLEDKKVVKKAIDYLLRFILEGTDPQDTKTYERLIELPLVPLYDDAVGTFCEMEYYIAEEDYRKLFNKTRLSHFVTELPFDVKNKEISKLLKISELDANSILNLLEIELPTVEHMEWNPFGESYPNKKWLDLILTKFSEDSVFEFHRLARLPLLPVIHPHQKLIRFDKSNSLLFRGGNLEYSLILVLYKLGVRFTELKLIDNAHPTLKEWHLLKSKLKICSLPHKKIFKVESDIDYDTLLYLKVKCMDEPTYIANYYDYMNIISNGKYLEFLKSALLLENNQVEEHLKNLELFREIFRNTDKILPIRFQEDEDILRILERMELKRRINSLTFIECAREIESKIHTTPKAVIKSLARRLMTELFSRYEELSFDPRQWEELLSIKFVPTDTNLQEHYGIYMEEIVSLNSACFYKYKDLVWTQVPLFDKLLDDPPLKLSNLCKPKLMNVINYWEAVTSIIAQTERTDWRYYGERKQFLDMMKEIYEHINSQINEQNKEEIKLRISRKKLFLNGNDPFELKSWVSGPSLVYGISEDIGKNLHKVSSFLEKCKSLLKLAGAEELIGVRSEIEIREHNQRTYLLDQLLGLLKRQEKTPHHDVEFCFPNNENIYANRYVLSDILEKVIVDECDANNVMEITEWANFCNAKQLKKHCLKYIKENQKLLVQKISKEMEDAEEGEEYMEDFEALLEEANNMSNV